jgi:dihydropyrimidinase
MVDAHRSLLLVAVFPLSFRPVWRCAVDFVIEQNGQSLVEAYHQWRGWADPKVVCDYAFHMAVTWWSPKVAAEMEVIARDYGINSFKTFMAYKGVFQLSDGDMFEVYKHCSKIGGLAQVHAENGDLIHAESARMVAEGITGPEGHELCRPEDVEGEATNRAIVIANRANCPLCVSLVPFFLCTLMCVLFFINLFFSP